MHGRNDAFWKDAGRAHRVASHELPWEKPAEECSDIRVTFSPGQTGESFSSGFKRHEPYE